MAKFTTRVELYEKRSDANKPDYEALHTAMEEEGFTRTISWKGDTTKYQMPHGEYNRSCELTTAQVRDSAVRAAKTVWTHFGVLVTKADEGREKYNLKRA